MAKLSPARCFHVQHKREQATYIVERTAKKDRQMHVPILLGYNNVQHRYELCDEGFVSTRIKLRRITEG